ATYEFTYKNSFSPTLNWESCHNTAVKAATNVLGEKKVISNAQPMMSSEDFVHFLNKVPGCLVFLGSKRKNEEVFLLHHAKIKYSYLYFIKLAKFFAEIICL